MQGSYNPHFYDNEICSALTVGSDGLQRLALELCSSSYGEETYIVFGRFRRVSHHSCGYFHRSRALDVVRYMFLILLAKLSRCFPPAFRCVPRPGV